jgi:hypothetical protein
MLLVTPACVITTAVTVAVPLEALPEVIVAFTSVAEV